jgi:hypothetical protein
MGIGHVAPEPQRLLGQAEFSAIRRFDQPWSASTAIRTPRTRRTEAVWLRMMAPFWRRTSTGRLTGVAVGAGMSPDPPLRPHVKPYSVLISGHKCLGQDEAGSWWPTIFFAGRSQLPCRNH